MDYNQGSSQVLGSLSDTSQLAGGSVASNSASVTYCVPGSSDPCSPPIGEWKLDEGTGTTANDSSGNGNSSTSFTGNPLWTTSKFGSGLNFSGGGKKGVNINDSPSLHLSNLTLEAWVNTKVNNIGQAVITKRDSWSTQDWELWLSSDGTVYMVVGEGAGMETPIAGICSYPTDTWFHLTVTKNGTLYTLYKNGVYCDSNNSSKTWTESDNIHLGIESVSDGNSLNGSLDDVKIYNYARTPSQVAWDYNRGAPIAQYDFDECSGNTLHDTAPKADKNTTGYNGTINASTSGQLSVGDCSTNAETMWYNGRNGEYNASLKFDGSDDYISIPDNDIFSFINGSSDRPFSLSAWIKAGGFATNVITAKNDYTSGNRQAEYGLSVNYGDPQFAIIDNSTGGYIGRKGSTHVSTGSWQHLTATYDGSASTTGIKIYLNGVRVDDSDYKSGSFSHMYNTTSPVTIGAMIDSTGKFANRFWGQIDDVRIYNYALTATQVKTLYNADSAVKF